MIGNIIIGVIFAAVVVWLMFVVGRKTVSAFRSVFGR